MLPAAVLLLTGLAALAISPLVAGVSVSYSGGPQHEYVVSVAGEDLEGAVAQVTRVNSTAGTLIPIYTSTTGGALRVTFNSVSGGNGPTAFSIVIWRP